MTQQAAEDQLSSSYLHTNSPDDVHHAKNVVWGEGQEMAVMVGNSSLKTLSISVIGISAKSLLVQDQHK